MTEEKLFQPVAFHGVAKACALRQRDKCLANGDGTLKTVIDGQEAKTVTVQFTNIYEELVTPPTGDNFNLILPIVLMLLSVLGVVAIIIFRKKRTV